MITTKSKRYSSLPDHNARKKQSVHVGRGHGEAQARAGAAGGEGTAETEAAAEFRRDGKHLLQRCVRRAADSGICTLDSGTSVIELILLMSTVLETQNIKYTTLLTLIISQLMEFGTSK